MRNYIKAFAAMALMFVGLLFVSTAFAQASDQLSTGDFLTQVVNAVKGFGGFSGGAKIACVIMLIVGSMKVTVLDDLIWNRLGPVMQVWIAPIFGLIAGIVGPLLSGGHFSLATAFAYASAGAGAVFLHQILDSVKSIPGIGPFLVDVIGAIESGLGGNPVSPAPKGSVTKSS